MLDFSVGATFSLVLRTAPFILVRMVVYVLIAITYLLAMGAGAGLGYVFGQLGNDPGFYSMSGALIGVGLISGILYLFREYLLYVVKAGHIAAMVQIMDGGAIPQGRSQIRHAIAEVRSRFKETSSLFLVDQLIKGVLLSMNRLLLGVTAMIPAFQGVMKLATGVINLSLTYVDEAILAHNIRTGSTNPWASSREALVLYAQNYVKMLKNALVLAFIVWGMSLLIFLLAISPFLAFVKVFPEEAGFLTVLAALIFTLAIKASILDPFAMAALIQAYFKVTQGQQPREDWSARLETASDKFRELGSRASRHLADEAWRTDGSPPPAG